MSEASAELRRDRGLAREAGIGPFGVGDVDRRVDRGFVAGRLSVEPHCGVGAGEREIAETEAAARQEADRAGEAELSFGEPVRERDAGREFRDLRIEPDRHAPFVRRAIEIRDEAEGSAELQGSELLRNGGDRPH